MPLQDDLEENIRSLMSELGISDEFIQELRQQIKREEELGAIVGEEEIEIAASRLRRALHQPLRGIKGPRVAIDPRHTGWFWFVGGKLKKARMELLADIVKNGIALTQPDRRAIDRLIRDAAEHAVEIIRADVIAGRVDLLGLSPVTKRKRERWGFPDEPPLAESFQLVNALKVAETREVQTEGGFGLVAAVSIDDTQHRPNTPFGKAIDMVKLFNILTRDGALIDISQPEVRAKVMAFLRKSGALDEHRGPKLQPGPSGKQYIYIPPRFLFRQEYLNDVARRVFERVVKPRVSNLLRAFGTTLQRGPTTVAEALQALKIKHRALEGGA